MVFSFFKKPPEKMPERASARPKGDSVPPASVPPVAGGVAPATPGKAPATPQEDWDLDFSLTNTQPNGSYGIEVNEEGDPFSEIAEHVAILYANGQDDAARATLESTIQQNGDPGAVKLWAMLFDLLRVKGERAAFDALCLEFAKLCELSPPSWDWAPMTSLGEGQDEALADSVALQGVLEGNDSVFDTLMQALSKSEGRHLDLGRLAGLDTEAAAKLAKLLAQARRRGLEWDLSGADGLVGRLSKRTVAGQAQEEPLWLLLLELFQYLGWEAQFEEKAVDYAVTFEVSPPSWEAAKAAAAKPAAAVAPPQERVAMAAFEGEFLQGNLQDLAAYLKSGAECRLDFSRVMRIDFVSAGALANMLKTSGAGPVVIYHPNRLVAELMRSMGIDQMAQIELSKY